MWLWMIRSGSKWFNQQKCSCSQLSLCSSSQLCLWQNQLNIQSNRHQLQKKTKNTAPIDSLTLGQICESDGRSVIKKGHKCGSGLLSEEAANMCRAMTHRGAS